MLSAYYLGIMNGHLYTGHSLALTVKLDLANSTEFCQHCCQVVFQVNHVTNAMSRAYQKCCSWLFLVLLKNIKSMLKRCVVTRNISKTKLYITSSTVWNSMPPNGGRSLSTRMYCSFPWSGGTCQKKQHLVKMCLPYLHAVFIPACRGQCWTIAVDVALLHNSNIYSDKVNLQLE